MQYWWQHCGVSLLSGVFPGSDPWQADGQNQVWRTGSHAWSILHTTTRQNLAFWWLYYTTNYIKKHKLFKGLCTWLHVNAVQIAQMTMQMSTTSCAYFSHKVKHKKVCKECFCPDNIHVLRLCLPEKGCHRWSHHLADFPMPCQFDMMLNMENASMWHIEIEQAHSTVSMMYTDCGNSDARKLFFVVFSILLLANSCLFSLSF